MIRFAVVVLVLASVAPVRSAAEPKKPAKLLYPPSLISMGSEREHGSMKVECEGEEPFNEMLCTFYTVSISPAKAPDDLESQVDDVMRYARDGDSLSKMCTQLSKNPAKPRNDNEPVGRWQLAAQERALFEQLCACADDSCRRAAARRMAAGPYDGVCKVNQFVSLQQRFRRTGDRTWMATVEAPACNVVTVMVLEHEVDSTYKWTLTQTRTGKPDLKNPVCAIMDLNKPLVYSWRFKPDTLLRCSAITL
jgi:hypothetical protein